MKLFVRSLLLLSALVGSVYGQVMHIQSVNQFNTIAAQGLVVVKFYMNGCPPCQAMASVINQLSQEYTNVQFLEVNIKDLSDVRRLYKVEKVPTLVLLRNGQEVGRNVGSLNINTARNLVKNTFNL